MSELSNKLAAIDVKVTALEASETSEFAALGDEILRVDAKIAELQAIINAGGATPADLALMDSLMGRIDVLKAQSDAEKAVEDAEVPAPPPPATPSR